MTDTITREQDLMSQLVELKAELQAKSEMLDEQVGFAIDLANQRDAFKAELAKNVEEFSRIYEVLRSHSRVAQKAEDERDAALEELAALKVELDSLAKQDRAIRRMFCAAVAKQPYMDDGEASDQEIDFLRDSPEDIQHKYQQRRAKALAAMKGESA